MTTTTTTSIQAKSSRQRRSTRARKPTKFDDNQEDDSPQTTILDTNHDIMSDNDVEDSDDMITTSGSSTSTIGTTITENGDTEIDWKDEHNLWDLTVAKLRDELRRRSEYVAGSKRQLINRILGKDPLCIKFRLNPENAAVEDEAEKLRRKYANGDNDSDDEDEPLEGPKGDASLWSNKQLKYKLKNLGYSTAGKRTTLLKRFRSVMHIQRQKELATSDIIDDPVNQEVVFVVDEKKRSVEKSMKRKRSTPYEEKIVDDNLSENEEISKIEDIKPQTKRRKVVRKVEELEEYQPLVAGDLQNGTKESDRPARYSEFTLTELDLCVSSSFIHVYNPELTYRQFPSEEDLRTLEHDVRELEDLKAVIKDKNLSSHIPVKNKELKTIEVYYSPSKQQSKVGSSSVRRSRKQRKGVSLQTYQSDSSLVISLSGIQSFPALKRLVCIGQLLTDVSPISNCPNLEHVFLSHNLITTIPALGKLKKLTALGLGFNQISDISSLRVCNNLQYLNLSYNRSMHDISPIATCSKLIELDLSGNSIKDDQIYQLLNFKSDLLILKLNLNEISSLRPIGMTFPNLQALYLSNNYIHDLSSLIYLQKLNELDLQHNEPLFHSLQVYNASKLRQHILRQEKQHELQNKRPKSRGIGRSIAPTVTAAEEDGVSLLTGSIYDTIVAAEQQYEQGVVTEESETLRIWMNYGKVNAEVLECLVQWNTHIVIGDE